MNLEQAMSRYPAFLVCEREGRVAPWPGPNCVNRELRPVSAWGGAERLPSHLLRRCLEAEVNAESI